MKKGNWLILKKDKVKVQCRSSFSCCNDTMCVGISFPLLPFSSPLSTEEFIYKSLWIKFRSCVSVISRTIENELFKQDWRSRKKVQIFQYIVLKWALALLIGLGIGLVGFFSNIAVENIAGFKLLLTNTLMSEEKWVWLWLLA